MRLLGLLFSLLVLLGTASAQPLLQQVEDAVRSAGMLPHDAQLRIGELTPVRGRVESVEVTRFDRRTGRFDARIALGERSAPISGRASVSIPVIAAVRTLRRGHTIRPSDLERRYVPLAQVPGDVFTLAEDLDGFAVRRSLAAGRPVRAKDVGAPLVVAKNEGVEIVYDHAGVTLFSKGRALEAGAAGDIIRVQTQGQDRQITGEIVAPGRVAVR